MSIRSRGKNPTGCRRNHEICFYDEHTFRRSFLFMLQDRQVSKTISLPMAVGIAVKIFFLFNGFLLWSCILLLLLALYFLIFRRYFFFPVDFFLKKVHSIASTELHEFFKIFSVVTSILTNSQMVHWILFIQKFTVNYPYESVKDYKIRSTCKSLSMDMLSFSRFLIIIKQ